MSDYLHMPYTASGSYINDEPVNLTRIIKLHRTLILFKKGKDRVRNRMISILSKNKLFLSLNVYISFFLKKLLIILCMIDLLLYEVIEAFFRARNDLLVGAIFLLIIVLLSIKLIIHYIIDYS
jgi:hypothetical protein